MRSPIADISEAKLWQKVSPWRICPTCEDFRHGLFVVAEGVVVRCTYCGQDRPLVCPSCSEHVRDVEDWKNAAGVTMRTPRCACGYTNRSQWNISGKRRRVRRETALAYLPLRCEACGLVGGRELFQVDHRVALGLDGADTVANMQPLCVPCHAKKTRDDVRAMR